MNRSARITNPKTKEVLQLDVMNNTVQDFPHIQLMCRKNLFIEQIPLGSAWRLQLWSIDEYVKLIDRYLDLNRPTVVYMTFKFLNNLELMEVIENERREETRYR